MAATLARLIILLLGVALLSFAPAQGAEPAPAVLIIDSSGSMAARLPDGRVKLDAARAVIGETLENWPASGQLAVVSYGHRRQSDCADIETMSQMSPVDAPAIVRQLRALMARGKTPISDSLVHAAALLPDGGSIVLVSDGVETCAADPCAVAAALKEAHAAVVIHVVGFGLTEEESEQLTCIAERTGGQFFSAGDAHALAEALNQVKEAVAESPPPPPPAPEPIPEPPPVQAYAPPVPEEPASTAPAPDILVRVNLRAVAGGELGIVDAPARWMVTDGDGKLIYEGESRALTLDLPAGTYKVVAEAANARGEAEITTTGEPGQSFDVSIVAGRLDLALAANKSATPFGDTETQGIAWTLEPLEGQAPVQVLPISTPSLLLAPGRYQIAAELRGMKAEAIAEVEPGKAEAITLDFALGTVTLEAVLEGEAEPIRDASMLGWRVGEGEMAQLVRGQDRPRLVLPEGRYPVVLTMAGGEVKGEAEVKAGEDSIARMVVGGGELTLSARLAPNSPVLEDWRDTNWTVAPADAGPDTPVIELPVAQPVVPVPPGRWRISLSSGTVSAEKEVDVGPGANLPMTFELDAARLTARGRPADGPPPDNIVFSFTPRGGDGSLAASAAFEGGAPEEAAAILKAGHWHISAIDSNGRSAEEDVELKAGEERVVELTLK